jgi:hypothetical protein
VGLTGAGQQGDGITVTHMPWALTYPDGSVIEPSSIGYRQFPQPEYPWDERQVPWNRCVRGWVTFGVPAGKPTMVEYQPQGEPVTDWKV